MPFPTRFTDMVGCRYPIQQAGIGGTTSPDLAIAVARAGALGMLSGTVGHQALSAQLDAVPTDLAVGVNFLLPFLDRGALEEASGRVRLIEFFWGEPDPELIELAHRGGARCGWQVGSAKEARAAQDAGCDVIVAQGVEAGGHVRGTTGLLPLLDEVRAVVDVPIVAAGGIGTGRAMAAALTAGADAVRVGTRFVAAAESIAHPAYVAALIDASADDTVRSFEQGVASISHEVLRAWRADDTVITTAFGEGWPDAPHRVLRTAITAGEARGEAQSWTPDWPSTDSAGAVEARALYAGQSVGAVRAQRPAAEIVAELVNEAGTK